MRPRPRRGLASLLPVAAPTTESEAVTSDAHPAPVRAPGALDEDDQPRARWERAVGWTVIVVCTFLVFCIIDPAHHWTLNPTQFRFGDLFRNTTTNGGDMGAHVWWPKFLIDNWFPKFRLSGWAPDWYAGFPVGQYYFPVPALDDLGAAGRDAVQRRVQARDGRGSVDAAGGGVLVRPRTEGAVARAARLCNRRVRHARADPQRLADLRRQHREHARGRVLVLHRARRSRCSGSGRSRSRSTPGSRRWLPALLIALAIMSHIVVAFFVAIAAILLWLTRRPHRTWRIAIPIGLVAGALSAVWLLPLAWQQAYTQSMRYTKLLPNGNAKLPSWLWLPGPVRHTLEGLWNAVGRPPLDPTTNPVRHVSPTLWLPWWMWLLAGVAIVAAGWYRRRSTLVLLVLALVFGVMFIEWPENTIWNTRFLPFWMLSWALLAAMGATEIARLTALAGPGSVRMDTRWRPAGLARPCMGCDRDSSRHRRRRPRAARRCRVGTRGSSVRSGTRRMGPARQAFRRCGRQRQTPCGRDHHRGDRRVRGRLRDEPRL